GQKVKTHESLPDHVNANGEQMAIAASSMIRSHRISGDLHGVQPDPIPADILRKEPEQEVFCTTENHSSCLTQTHSFIPLKESLIITLKCKMGLFMYIQIETPKMSFDKFNLKYNPCDQSRLRVITFIQVQLEFCGDAVEVASSFNG
ncbi:hypothetical protein PIB30_104331, partial [Stylosanthes scabra]|nr:hypothetical protein [Stylosanthes scabra]